MCDQELIRHRPDPERTAQSSRMAQWTASAASRTESPQFEKSPQFETSRAALPVSRVVGSCTVYARCRPSKSSGSCGPLALGPQHLVCLVLVVLGFSFGTTATQKELHTQKEQHSDSSSSRSCRSGRTLCLAQHHRSGPVPAPLQLHVHRQLKCEGHQCEDQNSTRGQLLEIGWLSLSNPVKQSLL